MHRSKNRIMIDKSYLHKIRRLLLVLIFNSILTDPGITNAAESKKVIRRYQIISISEDEKGNFVAYLNKPVTKPDLKTCDYLRINTFKCPILMESGPNYMLPQPSIKRNQPPSIPNLGWVRNLLNNKKPKSDEEYYLRAILWMSEIILNVTLNLSKTDREAAGVALKEAIETHTVIFSMLKNQIYQHKLHFCSSINIQLMTMLTSAFFHQIAIEDPMVDNDCIPDAITLSRSITK